VKKFQNWNAIEASRVSLKGALFEKTSRLKAELKQNETLAAGFGKQKADCATSSYKEGMENKL
jgi:hypothetical protein